MKSYKAIYVSMKHTPNVNDNIWGILYLSMVL